MAHAALSARTILLACVAAALPAQAATLRAFRLVPSGSVRLSDMFDDLACADRVLGAAPAPGGRILVQAPQLAAIARDYGVDWRPVTGAEQTLLERDATPFALADVTALLRAKLSQAGAPDDAAIALPDYAPLLLPKNAAPDAALADFTYDATTMRFTALLTVTVRDAPPLTAKLSGQAMLMVDAAVLTQPLSASTILTRDSLRATRLPVSTLRGETAIGIDAALGLALRRNVPAGHPLVMGDLMHPMLVTRNASVRMVLSAGAIALSAEGTALEDGAMGAHIRVQNPSSHAVMLAEITGADEVKIIPGHAPLIVAAQ
jgi:flagella basal body P-ring formation protein FlgA